MMRRPVLSAIVVLNMALPALADDRREPYEIALAFRKSQDESAFGVDGEDGARAKLFREFAEAVSLAPRSSWERLRNRQAIVWYLLAGGSPEAVRDIVLRLKLSSSERALMEGALASADGRDEDARSLLNTVDARSLPSCLGAIVALAQARSAQDITQKMRFLNVARLLNPGSLVEEAALRQEILVAADARDYARFTSLAQRYFVRFPKSVFAKAFGRRVVTALVELWTDGDDKAKRDLVVALPCPAPDDCAGLLLTLARESLIRGNLHSARWAAQRAVADLREDDPMRKRASFYEAAASVFVGDQASLAKLRVLDTHSLSSLERALLEGVLAMAEGVRKEGAEAIGAADQSLTPGMQVAVDRLAAAEAFASGSR